MRIAGGLLLLMLIPAQAFAQSADGTAAEPAPVTQDAPLPPLVIVEAPPPEVQPSYVEPRTYRGRTRVRYRVERYSGGPIPPDAHLDDRPNLPLLITGPSLLGAAWLSSIFGFFAGIRCVDYFDCSSPSGWLFVPVVGPWVALVGSDASERGGVYQAVLVVDGLAQVGGLAMLAAGVLVRHPVVVTRMPVYGRETAPRWTVLPGAPGSQAGLSVSGQF